MRTRALLFLLFFPVIACAGWINKQGEALPDSENRKSAGNFGAHLIFVGDENQLFQLWAVPSADVKLKTISSVKVNQAISAFIVFSGCAPDNKGLCNVTVRFRVIAPDGKVYADTPAMEVWSGKPAPPEKTLELSAQYLKVRIEPTDLLGKYVVHAEVRDHHAGAVLQLQSSFAALNDAK